MGIKKLKKKHQGLLNEENSEKPIPGTNCNHYKRQSSILKLDTSHSMCQSQTRIIMTNWPMLNVNYGELRSIINDKIGDGTYEMR